MLLGLPAFCHAQPGASFLTYTSDRYYTSSPSQPRAAWPVLPFDSVRALNIASSHTPLVALAADGSVHTISATGNTTRTTISPLSTGARIGALVLADAASIGIVACEPSGCAFYTCAAGGACSPLVPTVPMELGVVSSLSTSRSGDVWLNSRAVGLVRFSAPKYTPTRFGSKVVGNVTALAIYDDDHEEGSGAGAATRVAVSTELAVYYAFDLASGEFASHQLVGEDLDAVPTALSFVRRSLPRTSAASLRHEAPADNNGAGTEVELWIGHRYCLNVLRADGSLDRVSGAQGLPVGNITVLARGAGDGVLWVGSAQGVALRCERCSDTWRYFGGDRWLAGGSAVTSLAAAPALATAAIATTASPSHPSTWVSTPTGLAHITSRESTLEERAAQYTARVPALSRHLWVAGGTLRKYGDLSTLRLHDGDNDGLWTGMLVAAMAFRFAATKSEEARALAWRHFAAVEFLHNVTSTAGVAPGFIARSAVKCGEPHGGGDSGICPSGSPNSCGWANSSVCFDGVDPAGATTCCWQWKRDTSSDEVTGHVFTLLVVHQLLAQTVAEKARVARPLCQTVGYILDGGLIFIDPISGKGTSWGYWDPAQLNGVPGKPDERGENSLELLSYLAAAALLCDATATPPGRYGNAFAEMVLKHGYDENTVSALATAPESVATFDFRLAFMSYYVLATATPELARATVHKSSSSLVPLPAKASALVKTRLQRSVRRYWNATGATFNAENNRIPFACTVHQLLTGSQGLADPEWMLRRFPEVPLIDWPSHNSKRLDVRLSRDWLLCGADPASGCGDSYVIDRGVLPADEAFMHGSGDFVTEPGGRSVDGGSGTSETAPNMWLLAFWMHRYHQQ